MQKYKDITWMDEETYQKAEGQLRLGLNGVFNPFNYYGLNILVPGAIDEVTQLAVDFSLRLRGVDKPIRVSRKRNSREG